MKTGGKRLFSVEVWESVRWAQKQVINEITLPETNLAPENRPLEKEIPLGNHNFQVLCSVSFREGIIYF